MLNGKVLSLDAKVLKLQSGVLGEITLQREKVVTIRLGDPSKQGRQSSDASHRAATPSASTTPKAPAIPTVEDVLKQLQIEGIDAKTMGAIQGQFPLLANPEVQAYLGEKVTGLASGTIGIQDIRKDAVKVRDEIVDLKKDLGPQGDALNGYLSILESFIRRTDPGTPTSGNKPNSPGAARK